MRSRACFAPAGSQAPSPLFHRVERWLEGCRGRALAGSSLGPLGGQLVKADDGLWATGAANLCEGALRTVNQLVNIDVRGS